jgi:hypothetical protein
MSTVTCEQRFNAMLMPLCPYRSCTILGWMPSPFLDGCRTLCVVGVSRVRAVLESIYNLNLGGRDSCSSNYYFVSPSVQLKLRNPAASRAVHDT